MKKQCVNDGWVRQNDAFSNLMFLDFMDTTTGALPVILPEDFTIPLDVTPDAPGKHSVGFYPPAAGTYTRKFYWPDTENCSCAYLELDGVYGDTEVLLNNNHLGIHYHGYTPWLIDLSPYLNRGGENTIIISVSNLVQPNSRWYSGAGIYRDILLYSAGARHLVPHSLFVTTPEASSTEATIEVFAETEGIESADNVTARIAIYYGEECCCETETVVDAGKLHAELTLNQPRLWSPETPALYRAECVLYQDGKRLDADEAQFGVRTIAVSRERGLELNGETVKLYGGCLHHDNGMLGAVSVRAAEERRLRALKQSGYNAIRCAHNPPSTVMLDVCDRLGLLVIDEAFDMWTMPKNRYDYHLHFREHWRDDLTAMIRRDRNHPSVILWAIGSEITEMGGLRDGVVWTRRLAEQVRLLDPTRPINAAITPITPTKPHQKKMQRKFCMSNEEISNSDAALAQFLQDERVMMERWGENTQDVCEQVDVVGYNYYQPRYKADGEEFPDRIMCGTESRIMEYPEIWDSVLQFPFVIGDFSWSAVDYLGEAGCGYARYLNADDAAEAAEPIGYPWRISNCGDFDINMVAKPQLAFRQVVWGSQATHIAVRPPKNYGKTEIMSAWGWPEVVDSWSFPGWEEKPVQIDVYSRAEEVELFQNGVSCGVRPAGKKARYIAHFETTYQPGTLVAVSKSNGVEVSRATLETVGKPIALRVTPDKTHLCADGFDLCYVTVEVVDHQGNRVPWAEPLCFATADGAGRLAAFGSGLPNTDENYTCGRFHAFQGRLLAILRAGYDSGVCTLRVASDGLIGAECTVEIGSTEDC